MIVLALPKRLSLKAFSGPARELEWPSLLHPFLWLAHQICLSASLPVSWAEFENPAYISWW